MRRHEDQTLSKANPAKKIEFSFPESPVPRQAFFVQEGDYRCIGENHVVRKVTSRSFYIYTRGKLTRYPRTEWKTWLLQRAAEGELFLDGAKLEVPRQLIEDSKTFRHRPTDHSIQELPFALEAIKQGCQIESLPKKGPATLFKLSMSDSSYEISVSSDHSTYPQCSCGSFQQKTTEQLGKMCRHILTFLLLTPSLQFHLLDLFLPSKEEKS